MISSSNRSDPSDQPHFSPTFLRKKWGIILVILLLFGGLGITWIAYFAYPFLVISRPTNHPDTIIVEGWLPYHALRTVYEEIQEDSTLRILVIGAARGHREFTLGGHPHSAWTSYVEREFSPPLRADSVFISARGNLVDSAYGHIRVSINNQQVGNFSVSDLSQRLAFPLKVDGPIQKLTLGMDNTHIAPPEGIRKVYLQEIALDELALPLFSPHSFYSFSTAGGQRFEVSQEDNVAIVAGNMLEQMGIPEERLVVLPYEAPQGSRTVAGARETANWIQQAAYSTESIHLYSQGAHSRRSYEVYRKTLPDSIQLGVTALQDYRYDENWMAHPTGRRLLIEQLVKYLFYKIVFIR